jgi:hypothetical protein
MAYDAPTISALQSGALILRDLLWVAGWDSDGDPANWGFWTGEDDVTVDVIGGLTGTSATRSYVGGGTLLAVPAIVDAIGLESRSADFELSQVHTAVRDMVFGARIKGARVEMHRGVFSPATWELVSEPFVRFVGRLDTAEPVTAAAGAEGRIILSCSSDPIELTRTNPALKSDETLKKLQPGDTFRQYDTAGLIDVRWGQAKGKVKK